MDTPRQHLTLADLTDQVDDDTTTGTAGGNRWRQSFAELPAWLRYNRGLLFIRDNWLVGVFLTIALTATVGVFWLAWTIVSGIISMLGSGIGAAGDGMTRLADWLTSGPITHAISDPVRAFLDSHSAGLPATGRDLWIVWLVTAGVLYAAGLAGSTYARYGWAIIGALTGAAAYAGAAAGSGPAAAGVTAAVWLLLSLPVYARAKRYSVLEQIALDLAARRAAREHTATKEA